MLLNTGTLIKIYQFWNFSYKIKQKKIPQSVAFQQKKSEDKRIFVNEIAFGIRLKIGRFGNTYEGTYRERNCHKFNLFGKQTIF